MYGEAPIFYLKVGRKWQAISSKDYKATVDILAYGLIIMGISRGEYVATIFNYNCPQWNFLDMALAKIGAVHIPVYPTISDSDHLYILNQAKVRYVFVSDQVLYNKITGLQRDIPTLDKIITIQNLANIDSFDEVMQLGFGAGKEIKNELKKRLKDNNADDVVTIIYTSGSTGFPKGAMLTHVNLVSNMYAAAAFQPLGTGNRVMSFLPLCHVYERTANYQFQVKGAAIYYCENLKSLTTNMREVKPHGITVVPRLLEKVIKFAIVNTRKGNLLVRLVVAWAIRFGFHFRPYKKKKPFFYRVRYKLADLTLFRMVRYSFGGKIKYIGCGGAPLNEKVTRFFWAAKMPVYEGYGLSECSPLVSLNYPGKSNYWIGTVGPIVENVKVKIANDGEILCKGPNVMQGYFKLDDLTEQTLKEGWLHTGDIGRFEKGKYLKITGRKKQMFKTSYGKYIVPQAIENKFIGSPLIDYLVVIGEGRHCAAAIISPNFSFLRKKYDKQNKLSNVRLIATAEVKKAISKEVEKVNKELGKTERIQKHLIVPDVWSPYSGELSPTLKIKRNLLQKKYRRQIQLIYHNESI
jgi:long-chain acyl-CoA synthetase